VLIIIPRKVPSQNNTQYRHWRAYTKERDIWFTLLRAQLPPRNPPTVRMKLTIRSYRAKHLDYGNLVGGAKPIPDGLVRLGYIKDDSPTWLDSAYHQEIVPKSEERTEIEWWPA
jgi:hypothetical protein